MIWGAFFENVKGPFIIWEKEWGTINLDIYYQHILPII
jgi:hypothetical protein